MICWVVAEIWTYRIVDQLVALSLRNANAGDFSVYRRLAANEEKARKLQLIITIQLNQILVYNT